MTHNVDLLSIVVKKTTIHVPLTLSAFASKLQIEKQRWAGAISATNQEPVNWQPPRAEGFILAGTSRIVSF